MRDRRFLKHFDTVLVSQRLTRGADVQYVGVQIQGLCLSMTGQSLPKDRPNSWSSGSLQSSILVRAISGSHSYAEALTRSLYSNQMADLDV